MTSYEYLHRGKRRIFTLYCKCPTGAEAMPKLRGYSAQFARSRRSISRGIFNIESFNGSFRDECLNVNWFMSLEDARDKIESWRKDYNEFRPHSSLTYLTPAEFALKSKAEAV